MRTLCAALSIVCLAALGCKSEPLPRVYQLHLTLTGALVVVRSPHDHPKTIWVLLPQEETPFTHKVDEGLGTPVKPTNLPPHYAILRVPEHYLHAGGGDEIYYYSLRRTQLSIDSDDRHPLNLSGDNLLAQVPAFLPGYGTVLPAALAAGLDPSLSSRLQLNGGDVAITNPIPNPTKPTCYTFWGGGTYPKHAQNLGEDVEVTVTGAALPQLRIQREVKGPCKAGWTTYLPRFRPILDHGKWVVNLTIFDSPADIIYGGEDESGSSAIEHFAYAYGATTMPKDYPGPWPVPYIDPHPPVAGGHPYCTVAELVDGASAPSFTAHATPASTCK
jgi:hypothetical protein